MTEQATLTRPSLTIKYLKQIPLFTKELYLASGQYDVILLLHDYVRASTEAIAALTMDTANWHC